MFVKSTGQREFWKTEKDYVSNILRKSLQQKETKTFWHYAKSKHNDSLGISLLTENGVLLCDGQSKARMLHR